MIHRAGILQKHRKQELQVWARLSEQSRGHAAHGEAETDASSLAVSYSLSSFQTGSTSTSVSSPVVLNADSGPGLWWNWVMHTQRCPRLCCLACSCFSRRAQGCPTFLIYLLPPRWPSSDKAKKESVISPGLSSASQSKKDEGIFSVFSKSQQQTNLSTNSTFHKYSFPRSLYLMIIHTTASENQIPQPQLVNLLNVTEF